MIGQTISHYKILEKLGEGGMGVVYKALDLRLQRKVALKMLPASLAGLSKSDRERFLREAQATSSLDHPNICTVYEIDETPEGHVFIAMALYEGETLAEKIKRGPLDHEDVLRIGSQVGLGLQAAHEQGIVHRDIKSANIMLTKTGQVKIMDFGVAKYASAEGITQSGMRIGTLAYMSPEQAEGKSVDHRADIWSFGVVFYEMVTGTLPFDAAYEYGLLYAIIHDRPSELSQRQSAAHPEFQSIVDRCLEKDPQRRYKTAAQVVDHILSVGAPPPPASRTTAIKRIFQRSIRFVRIRWVATLLAAFFVFTGIALYFLLGSIDLQTDVIVYMINYEPPKKGVPVVTEAVLDYLLRDELEQSSYTKIVTEAQFAEAYPGKTPAVEATFDVRAYSLSNDIKLRVERASAFPIGGNARYDTTFHFGDASALLKGITASIADKVLRVAGIDQKKASTFTSIWDAFEKFYEGEKAWQKLNVTAARQAFEQALGFDSKFVLARLRYADVLRFENANADAQANIRMIESDLGKLSVVDSLKARALIALLAGDLKTNVDLLRQVRDRKPWAVESSFDLAEGYYRLCNIKQAKDNYLTALAIDSNYSLAYNHLAYCYTHLGEHEPALAYFEKYLRLDSTANSYDSYGDGLFAAGQLDRAAWAKERAISLNAKLTYSYQTLFFIRLFQGQLRKAEESIVKFREYAFSDELKAKTELFYGLLDFYQNRNSDALSHGRRALQIFDRKDLVTRNHDLHWLLGLIYLRMGRQEAARQELDEMEKLVAANGIDAANYIRFLYKSTLHLRACIAAKTGDFQTVNKFYEALDGPLKTRVKDNGSAFDLSFFYTALGELYLEPAIAKPAYAEECFKKSLEYNPFFPFAHHRLWMLYLRENKLEQAAGHRRELEKVWKDADPEWKTIYFAQREK